MDDPRVTSQAARQDPGRSRRAASSGWVKILRYSGDLVLERPPFVGATPLSVDRFSDIGASRAQFKVV